MKEKGLSQEGLKRIACVTMLIDHVGAVLVYNWYLTQSRLMGMSHPQLWDLYISLRIIGRIAFPIYCFLLVEGFYHTRSFRRYCSRMVVGMLLAEIPFNLAFSGTVVDASSTSVMVTLVLGLLMMACMQRVGGVWQIAVILPFCILAELLRTDYAGNGIMIIAMFALIRNHPWEKWLRLAGSVLLLWFGGMVSLGPVRIPIELFGLLSLIPIFLYSGGKSGGSKAAQLAFYLFYPVHLMVLWLIKIVIW